MAWGMVPCLGSAMCACTWHFFYNSPDLKVCLPGLPTRCVHPVLALACST